MSYNSPRIMEIFDEMDSESEEEGLDGNASEDSTEDWEVAFAKGEGQDLLKEPKPCDEAIKSALAAEKEWKDSSLQRRANALHKAWGLLASIGRSQAGLKNKFSLFIDYLDFYCDVLLRLEECKGWRPQGVTVIVSSHHSELFPFAATVPAALAAGCSVVAIAAGKTQTLLLYLQEVLLHSGVPSGVFNVVAKSDDIISENSMMRKVSKVFFCGPYSPAQEFNKNSLVESFSFFCPNNTAALVLESADLDSAADKIICETWEQKEPFFAVSTVVVQESVYQEFFDTLKYKMKQHFNKKQHSAEFRDEVLAEMMRKIKSKALLAGASVFECETENGHWGPTVITNVQSQDISQDMPLIRLLLCRTAKEGVALLNNCRYTLGTSVWSEISSQALEISSKLISPNVWVNSHGVCAASVPLQLSGFSGNCVLGGLDGLLEFASLRSGPPQQVNDTAEGVEPKEDKDSDWGQLLEVAASAHQRFRAWQSSKDRRQLLREVAKALLPDTGLHDIVQYHAHSQGITSMSDTMPSKDFFHIKEKIPKGVILLLINSHIIDNKLIVSLITPAVSLGNALIIVFQENNPLVQCLTQTFAKILPKNLVNVIVGMQSGICLISHPIIQAVWLYKEGSLSKDFLQTAKSSSARNMKRIWIVPETLPLLQHFLEKECLQSKVVWLPKTDEFP